MAKTYRTEKANRDYRVRRAAVLARENRQALQSLRNWKQA